MHWARARPELCQSQRLSSGVRGVWGRWDGGQMGGRGGRGAGGHMGGKAPGRNQVPGCAGSMEGQMVGVAEAKCGGGEGSGVKLLYLPLLPALPTVCTHNLSTT